MTARALTAPLHPTTSAVIAAIASVAIAIHIVLRVTAQDALMLVPLYAALLRPLGADA